MKFFGIKLNIIIVGAVLVSMAVVFTAVTRIGQGNDGQGIDRLSWEKYVNEESSYAFEYPEDWEIIESDADVLVYDPQNKNSEIRIAKDSAITDGLAAGITRLIFKIDNSNVPAEERKYLAEGLRSRTKRRLATLGFTDVTVAKTGLVVEFEGAQKTDPIKQSVLSAPTFEFQEVKEKYRSLTDFRKEDINDLFMKTSLNGSYLTGAELSLNPPIVDITFNEKGAELLEDLTGRNLGLPLAIVLDDEIIAAPTISEPIVGGTVRLEGVLNPAQALETAGELKALIFSPRVLIQYEISCGEQDSRECRGTVWSENGNEADVVPNLYVEVHKTVLEATYLFSVISDEEASLELGVLDHLVSSFQTVLKVE